MMVRNVSDRTGRFVDRPHYEPKELDLECESIVSGFLKEKYDEVKFPVLTDDLASLIEREADDLDLYADLSEYGPDVEGLTEFNLGRKPSVKISASLADNARRENRLRTTLSHEYGHVHFHAYLWEVALLQDGLFMQNPNANKQICKRDTILEANSYDWMEWQAGYVCGAILMPMTHVRQLVSTYRHTHGLFGGVGHASEHGQVLIYKMQEAFQVSAEAAKVRLFKLGVLARVDAGPSLFSF